MSQAPSSPEIGSKQVLAETRGSARWIYLNRPESRNALSTEMIQGLRSELKRARTDASIRVVVLTGKGKAFCAGADLKAESDPESKSVLSDPTKSPQNPFASALGEIQSFPKPFVAAINGPAFGGGLGLIAAADIAIAAEDATFSFSEVRLGLIPAMISVVVLPKLGAHQARRLFLTGRRFSAQDAIGYGLIHEAVPPDRLQEAVDKETRSLTRGGPKAQAEIKKLIEEVPTLSRQAGFERTSAWIAEITRTDESREGVAAFRDKRSPSWTTEETVSSATEETGS